MNYLIQGGENAERLTLLISLTSIKSEDVIDALHDHLVKGLGDKFAATLNGIEPSNFSRAFKTLNATAATVERIKELDWAKFKKSV